MQNLNAGSSISQNKFATSLENIIKPKSDLLPPENVNSGENQVLSNLKMKMKNENAI